MNNPVNAADPTGHDCRLAHPGHCLAKAASGAADAFGKVAEVAITAMGSIMTLAEVGSGAAKAYTAQGPDTAGLAYVGLYAPSGTSIYAAAGVAVQSQWYSPGDVRWVVKALGVYSKEDTGLGLAQVSDAQMELYGLTGMDQMQPEVAVLAMEKRIGLVQDACRRSGPCSATDLLIAAALGQNGNGFTAVSMNEVGMKNGRRDWERQFSNLDPKGGYTGLRERATGNRQYDNALMLRLYILDLNALIARGWKMPDWYNDIDWARIYQLMEIGPNNPD